MGVVYKATQVSLERVVALKVIRDEIASESEYRQRFLREARLAASVDHPHVVTVYDVGNQDDQLFLAMQWIDGPDLKEVLESSGRLAPERAIAIATQLAGALDAVHSVSGLIHRDVKPANVLLSQVGGEDHAYLTDFGVAKPPQTTDGLTRTGWTVGTTGYLSPEQIKGHEPGPRSDLYALGCLFFEALTGQPPFKAENEMAVRWAHANDKRPTASAQLPALGQRYDHFLSVALAVDPGQRFDSGRAFAEALGAAYSNQKATAITAPVPAQSPAHPPTAVGPPTPLPPAPHNPQTPPQPPYGYVTPPPSSAPTHSGNPLALILLAMVAVAGIAVGALAAAGVFSNSSETVSASTRASTRRRTPTSARFRESTTTRSIPIETTASQPKDRVTSSEAIVEAPGVPAVSRMEMTQEIQTLLLSYHQDVVARQFGSAWGLLSARKRQQYLREDGYHKWERNQDSLSPYLSPSGLRAKIEAFEASGVARVLVTGMGWSAPGASCTEWSGLTWVKYEHEQWTYDPGYSTTPARRQVWEPRSEELLGGSC